MRYFVSLLPSARLSIAWQRALDPGGLSGSQTAAEFQECRRERCVAAWATRQLLPGRVRPELEIGPRHRSGDLPARRRPPMATNEATGATWRLLATNTVTDPCRHLFMHPAHPDFHGECAVAHVDDRGDAAELAVFAVLVPGVDIDDLQLEELNGT